MFPCKNCLVKACCTAYCNKLIDDGRVIALYLLSYNTCPDCENFNIEVSPDKQLMLCQKCKKVFVKQLQMDKDDHHILGASSSSSSSGGNSSSISSSPSITITSIGLGPQVDGIITGISKYRKVRFPKPNQYKKAKSEYIPDPVETVFPKRNNYTTFNRMTPLYSNTLIKNMDILTNSRLSIPENYEKEKVTRVPDWIFKHENLFIKNPNDPETEEDYGGILHPI